MTASQQVIKSISSQIQIFQTSEQKETFLFILGALLTRLISLKKAAEIMEMEPEAFLTVLDLLGIDFSYLSDEDVELEQTW
jgi:predicted HTH domain antitoxin